MNNPNPFVPQGSMLEQKNATRSRVKLAVFCIVAVNVLGIAALLINGCKRETEPPPPLPPVDTNPPPVMDTNPPVALTTNPITPIMNVNPAVPPAASEYVVVKGDTLSSIAKKFNVTIKAIETANPGVVPTKMPVGQKLAIPAPSSGATAPTAAVLGTTGGEETYTVKSGDTLSKIAKDHGVTIKALETANNLTSTQIKVGQKLKIPAKAEPAAPAPVTAPETAAPAAAPVAPLTPPAK